RRVTLLPEPDSPRRHTTRPRGRVKETPLTASTLPPWMGNWTERSRTSRRGAVCGAVVSPTLIGRLGCSRHATPPLEGGSREGGQRVKSLCVPRRPMARTSSVVRAPRDGSPTPCCLLWLHIADGRRIVAP